ncbi:MAG: hypothetical protein ACOCVB_02270 [Bacillota bacterium]
MLGSLLDIIIGSVAMIPGFISYPLAGVLLTRGVSYSVFTFTSY